jgi:type I restriction enzyme M protein
MNLMLHGLGNPDVVRRNTLEHDIRAIKPEEQHDVVLTNPPFGGNENPQVQENFPLRSSSTQLLFMQHIAAKLRTGGRLGVVLPESFMSNGGVFETFRRRLLTERNVHTVVSLPAKGIWYKDVKTVLLFADGEGPTDDVLFVEVLPPPGQKNFTKRKPISRKVLEPYLEIVKERRIGDSLVVERFSHRARRARL